MHRPLLLLLLLLKLQQLQLLLQHMLLQAGVWVGVLELREGCIPTAKGQVVHVLLLLLQHTGEPPSCMRCCCRHEG